MAGVLAAVVTHNRLDLLRSCIDALLGQSVRPDSILVVNNASTDGTSSYLGPIEDVDELKLPENRGGSYGFAVAVSEAVRREFDFVWLMDDDARPHADALELLFEGRDPEKFAWLAATVVDGAGIPIRSHQTPGPAGYPSTEVDSPVFWSTFVGVLVNVKLAAMTWLPVAKFFILWDDTEYTARLTLFAPGLRVANALVEHPVKADLVDLGDRFFYDIRNRIWVIKARLGSRECRAYVWRTIIWRMRRQWNHTTSRRQFVISVVRAVWVGLLTSPSVEMPAHVPPSAAIQEASS